MNIELPKKHQVPILVLFLEREALEAVLEIPKNHIASKNDVDVIIVSVDHIRKIQQFQNTKHWWLLKHSDAM